MKRKLTYSFLLFSLLMQLPAQSRQFNLAKGSSQLFGGYLYCYGFLSQEQKASFCIYRLNLQLKTIDSLVIPAKDKLDSYLQASSDTLHNFLNIYLQKKEKKLVTVLRFNKRFEPVATLEQIDVARLNSIAAFESELLYAGRDVYTVKSQADSVGRQFYLNKFSLKSELANFDYTFAWQFAFERQYINSAHVFYANRRVVLLYVTVNGGPKAGQWILSIQAATGKLIRGTKLNDKGEGNTYQFGAFIADSVKRSLTLTGQKFTDAQLPPGKKPAFSNAPALSLYLIEIDSTGDITAKQDFRIPMSDAKAGPKKAAVNYLFRIGNMSADREGKLLLDADLFKNSDNSFTYLYAGTNRLQLARTEEGLSLARSSVASHTLIGKFYESADKTDRNGKISVDSLPEFDRLFYKPLHFPVKQAFKTDAENNPIWLLKKSTPKKNTISYALLSPVKKAYQLQAIEEVSTTGNPVCLVVSGSAYLIGRQRDGSVYELKLYAW